MQLHRASPEVVGLAFSAASRVRAVRTLVEGATTLTALNRAKAAIREARQELAMLERTLGKDVAAANAEERRVLRHKATAPAREIRRAG